MIGKHPSHSKREERVRIPPLLSAVLLLLWMEGVIAAYFWVHKPWPSDQKIEPLMVFVDLFIVFTLVALAGGIGRFIFCERLPFSPVENTAIQVALGMGILSIIVFIVALFGILGVRQAWYGLGIGVLLFFKPILAWLREWRAGFQRDEQCCILEKASRWLVVFLIVIAGLHALAPPLKWDSLVYHLELPQRYIEVGKIVHLSDNLFSGFPQLVEIMFTWAFALRSGTTAATLGWAVGVIAVLGLGGFSERLVGKGYRWLTPAILLTGASISRGLSWAYVDLWALYFGLATIIILEHYYRTKKRIWVGFAALFAGFAFSTKYTAGIIIPIGVIYLLVAWIQFHLSPSSNEIPDTNTPVKQYFNGNQTRSKSLASLFVAILLFICLAGLVTAPWLIKNYAITGNPVYPFLFEAKDMDELRLSFYQGETYDPEIADHLILPIEGTIFGIEGGPKFNTSISPLFLALIPAVVLGWRNFPKEARSWIIRLGIVTISAWIIWAIGSQIASPFIRTRHYYVVFPALALLATFGYAYLRQLKIGRIEFGWIVQNMMIFVFVLSAITESLYFAKADPIRVLSGFQTRDAYLAEQLGWYGPAMEAVNALPRGSKVAMFWEARAYYCVTSCSPDVILDRWWHLMRTAESVNEVTSKLRFQGYTHVLVYDLGVRFIKEGENIFTPEDWDKFERFKENELQLLQQFDDTYSLYAIPPSTPACGSSVLVD